MSTTQTTYVAKIGGSGPKATAVTFAKNENGVKLWAWIPNEQAESLVPGHKVTFTVSKFDEIERTYTVEGQTFELKVPRQQCRIVGEITVDAPDTPDMEPVTIVVTDAARAYAEAYRAKASRSTNPVEGDKAPF